MNRPSFLNVRGIGLLALLPACAALPGEQSSIPPLPTLAIESAAAPSLAPQDDKEPAEAASEKKADYVQKIKDSKVEFEMVWIADGNFWIGRHEVTWDEFLLYCDFENTAAVPPDADAVSKPSKPLDWTPYDHNWGVGKRPAVGMSWNSAKKYCRWLSLNTGVKYRLPTEEEWELACGPLPEGSLEDYAWFKKNSLMMTWEVGEKEPNKYGLHDMLGNLWEYCANPFSEDEPERAVLRGGSWKDASFALKPNRRLGFDDDWTLEDPNFPPGVWWIPGGNHLGLRLLRAGEASEDNKAKPKDEQDKR